VSGRHRPPPPDPPPPGPQAGEPKYDLATLGWDDAWAAAFAPHAAEGLHPARVAIEFNHIYRLYTDGGEVLAQHAGRFRVTAEHRHELSAVGDWVAARVRTDEPTATIEAVLPRRSRFSRKAAGDLTEEQVVAANIDVVFLVMALDRDYNPRRLERYLVLAHESGATPVVLLSKADLAADVAERVAEVTQLSPGTAVHAISAPAGQGLDVVRASLGPGRTGALLGSSGVGKSTLLNALVGTEVMKTQEVRAADSRGRHTTRHRHLIVLPGQGLLIDTPGMRELQLWDVTDALKDTFEDVEALAPDCHFTNCRHLEEPRCAVKAAVDEGRLAPARLESYRKLQEELRSLDGKKDVRARIEERGRSKVIGKALTRFYKDRGR
jgi:ribosome biogenesis GTPase